MLESGEWLKWQVGRIDPPVSPDTLVDVLYDDDEAFRTLKARDVEWHRAHPPLALWRLHERP